MEYPEYPYDVFISYRWENPDVDWVRDQLCPKLREAQLRVCLDTEDFVPGRGFLTEMSRAGRESRRAICVITPAYFEGSRPVQFELLLLRAKDFNGQDSKVIFLLLRKTTNIPDHLRDLIALFVSIDWTNSRHHEREWRKLLTILEAPLKDVSPPQPASRKRHVKRQGIPSSTIHNSRNSIHIKEEVEAPRKIVLAFTIFISVVLLMCLSGVLYLVFSQQDSHALVSRCSILIAIIIPLLFAFDRALNHLQRFSMLSVKLQEDSEDKTHNTINRNPSLQGLHKIR